MSPSMAVLAENLQFPEGPVWAEDGTLYVTEINGGVITSISPDGSKSTFANTGGSPNGAAFGLDGNLYVTNNGGIGPGYIQKVYPSGFVEILYSQWEGQPLQGPNDLVMDAYGGFYFTDPGPISRGGLKFGHVYYALTDGSRIKRLQYYFYMPNGVALSPDNSTLIVLESVTSRVWAIPIEGQGMLGQVDAGARAGSPKSHPNSALLTNLLQPLAPDGMCLDDAGNLLICAHNGGFISVHAPDGTFISTIQVEDRRVTNCCFGGKDLKTLYITESGLGRVITVSWERPGLRLNHQ